VRVRLLVSERFSRRVERLPPASRRGGAARACKVHRSAAAVRLELRKAAQSFARLLVDQIGEGDRILLKRISDDEFEAIDVGTHDIYDRLK
jgi:hypothetical protein